ncbi:hypothetical protein K505DRAFT_422622 [Melanomma pulvis-pyrius CBS 109.77]|uniref:Rhodopsin domain-containing protein n=1 Tax=Melanomma pulvis-pyrius CBS 109.77 TaxID=1314802 RepID=A0A6A6WPV6_9PLEO|nr:hypothetical protein K505DRAFT_422622 [Melanomma pulvis-pyrius CBS 109.77]
MSSAAIFDNSWHSSNPNESITLVVRIILCWTAVGIRVGGKLARKQSRGSIYWDDFFIVIALLLGSIGPVVTLWALTKGGAGPVTAQLIKEGKYHDAQKYLLAIWISGTAVYATLACIRLSILVFYRTIFGVNSKFRKASIALGVFNILWMLGAILGTILLCKPVSHYWDPLGSGSCGNALQFLLIVTIFDILIDVVLLILPIPQLLMLNASLRTKVAIIGIFFVGIFVVITNIIRLRYLYQPGGKLINQKRVVLWTSIHVTAAFICASLPLSKPVLVKIVAVSQTISQYALSLLGSGSGSHHSLSGSVHRPPKTANSDPEGNFIRMEDYNSENSLRLDGRQYKNVSEIQGASEPSNLVKTSPSKFIAVENRVEVS